MAYDWHRPLESRSLRFSVYTFLAILVGGLVLLIPPYFMQGTVVPIDGVEPYTALELEGRDVYIREGCNNCHSQMIRPFKTETDRYGPFTMAGENRYDRPFLYGSRRTGPDLARVGGKYPDSWHWIHFRRPKEIEPRSNMPDFSHLYEWQVDLDSTRRKLEVLRFLGHPYTDEQLEAAASDARSQAAEVVARLRSEGMEVRPEEELSDVVALIAYMQGLGTDVGRASIEAVRMERLDAAAGGP
jgi:cytochrome c oxidase cbb3-type subunit I/II